MWLRDAVVPWQATSSSSASTGGKKNYSCRVVLPSRGLERGRGGWGPRLLSRPSLTRASATSVPRAHRRTFVAPFRSRYSRNRLFFLFLVFFPPFLSLSLASRSAHSANRDKRKTRWCQCAIKLEESVHSTTWSGCHCAAANLSTSPFAVIAAVSNRQVAEE